MVAVGLLLTAVPFGAAVAWRRNTQADPLPRPKLVLLVLFSGLAFAGPALLIWLAVWVV